MRFNKIFLNKNIVFLMLCFFLNFVIFFNLNKAFAWEEPTCDPPDCNVQLPINTSDTAQTKTGKLTLSQGLKVTGTSDFNSIIVQGGNMLQLGASPSQAYIQAGATNIPGAGFIRANLDPSGSVGISLSHSSASTGVFDGISIIDSGNSINSRAILISSSKANGVYSSTATGNAIIGAVTGAGIGIWGSSLNNVNGIAGRFDGQVYFNSYNLSSLLTIKNGALTASGTIQSDTLKTASDSNGKCLYADSNGVIRAKSGDCAIGSSVWGLNGTNIYNTNSGNVGIGTMIPEKDLHIKNISSNAEINIQSSDSPKWGIYQDNDTDDLRFWNSDNRFTITSEGKVGIGTISPSIELDVNGDGKFYYIQLLHDGTNANHAIRKSQLTWANVASKPNLNCSFATPFATGVDLNTGAMVCTTTPASSLGSITGSGSENYIAKWETNNEQLSDSILYEKDGKLRIGGFTDPTTALLEINTSGTQGLRINSSGSSRSEQFSIANNSGTKVFCINESGSMGIGSPADCNSSNSLNVDGAVAITGQLDVDGSIQATSVSGGAISGTSLNISGSIKGNLGGSGNRCLYADTNGTINAKLGDCTVLYGGATRKIAFWTSASELGSSLLYQNTSNTRIGVNNTNPSVTLDVTGEIKASGSITGGSISSTGNISATGEVRGSTFSVNGNTGLGTSSSPRIIKVKGNDNVNCDITVIGGLITNSTCP